MASLAPASADIQYRLEVLRLWADPDGSTQPTPWPYFHRALQLDTAYDKELLQTYLDALPEAEALRRFARAVPNTPESHLRAARLLESSHWRQARLYYHAAMILSQEDPETLRAYGWALQRQREFATARPIWERLTALSPRDANAYVASATTLTKSINAWRGNRRRTHMCSTSSVNRRGRMGSPCRRCRITARRCS